VDDKLVLKNKDGNRVEDPSLTCNMMADFFEEKVKGLANRTGLGSIRQPYKNFTPVEHYFRKEQIIGILKDIKKKKSHGIDGIPMNVVVDTAPYIIEAYIKLFDLVVKKGYPALWKKALVKPLHKAGSADEMSNYRPISNLCSL